eukprot:4316028-Amphidinium_carterae.2
MSVHQSCHCASFASTAPNSVAQELPLHAHDLVNSGHIRKIACRAWRFFLAWRVMVGRWWVRREVLFSTSGLQKYGDRCKNLGSRWRYHGPLIMRICGPLERNSMIAFSETSTDACGDAALAMAFWGFSLEQIMEVQLSLPQAQRSGCMAGRPRT